MRLLTYYADCVLPEKARLNQHGFDWRGAIALLTASAARFGYPVTVVTDISTPMQAPVIRVGDAKEQGLMQWLLHAQAETIARADEPSVMVSPDTLIAGRLDWMFGQWDLALLTRAKPKPIVNSVIAFIPSDELLATWRRIESRAEGLSAESLAWGADIDAVVDVLSIAPAEDGERMVDGVRVRLLPMKGRFHSVRRDALPVHSPAPIWDFKGARKSQMPGYAGLLGC